MKCFLYNSMLVSMTYRFTDTIVSLPDNTAMAAYFLAYASKSHNILK